MVNILFFAQTRELIGLSQLEIAVDRLTLEQLRQQLSTKGDNWALALEKGKVIHTINQVVCAPDQLIYDGDEVAFFPPVTGG